MNQGSPLLKHPDILPQNPTRGNPPHRLGKSCRILVAAGLAAWGMPNAYARSRIPIVEMQLCRTEMLATRSGSVACPLRWAARDPEGRRVDLCVSEGAFGNAPIRVPRCGLWRGKLRTISAPSNLHDRPKRIRLRFIAVEAPATSPSPPGIRGLEHRAIEGLGYWERIRERASQLLREGDRMGLLRQLVLDEKNPLGAGDLLRKLGFVHLISATGIHLYALALAWDRLLRAVFGALGLPVRLGIALRRGLVGLSWVLAWMLAGARPGMLRPWAVASLRAGARFAGYRWRRYSPLTVALLLDGAVAIARGEIDTGPARIGYALCVGGGMIGQAAFPRFPHLSLAIGSWIFAALAEAWTGGWVALGTPLFSLISLPVFGAWVYPGLLVAIGADTLGLSHAAAMGVHVLAKIAHAVLLSGPIQWALAWPIQFVISREAWWLGVALGTASLLAGIALARRTAIWVAIMTAILAAIASGIGFSLIPPDALRPANRIHSAGGTGLADQVEQLDVGQGDSAWIRGWRGDGLVDSGASHALRDADWLAAFAERQLTHLDWVLLTHLDADHAGGIRDLTRLLPVRCVAMAQEALVSDRGQRLARELRGRGTKVGPIGARDCLPFPAFEIPPTRARRRNAGNAIMSAILVPLRGGGFYISAGDADREQETRLIDWVEESTQSLEPGPRYFKVSHHGSRFSSDPAFLARLRPSEAWISVGVGNSYGHPTDDALSRVEATGARLRRTDLEGAIRMSARAGPLRPIQKN